MNSFLSSFLFFFLLTILSNGVCEEDLSLVQTKQGTVQGISLNSRENQKYYGWLGVLFGKVEERFGVILAKPCNNSDFSKFSSKDRTTSGALGWC